MRKSDLPLAKKISEKLTSFEDINDLPGIVSKASRECLLEQMVDSCRRIKYVTTIAAMNMDQSVTDPTKKTFDPLKAAVWFKQNGNIEEAFWLTFLATHFGKNKKSEWELLRNIYKGDLKVWMWKDICVKTKEFRAWLDLNKDNLKKTGNFSNHRKYESLSGLKSNGTGAAIQSYVEWVGQSHKELINKIIISSGSDPRNLFQALYQSMSAVNRFGRTGKFDYLTMIGKLGIVFIEPPSTYMIGATGPVRGAQLLFGGPNSTPKSNNQLEILLNDLESHLGLYFGMQVLEDSLCNWQKSPTKYIYFWG